MENTHTKIKQKKKRLTWRHQHSKINTTDQEEATSEEKLFKPLLTKTKKIWKPERTEFGNITLAVALLTLALTYKYDYHEPNLDSSGTLELTIRADLLNRPSKSTGKET